MVRRLVFGWLIKQITRGTNRITTKFLFCYVPFVASTNLIQPCLRFLDHRADLRELVERKRGARLFADSCGDERSIAAAGLSKDSYFEITERSILRFKAGKLRRRFINTSGGVDGVHQWLNLLIIHKSPIVTRSVAFSVRTFSRHDHDKSFGARNVTHLAHVHSVDPHPTRLPPW